MGTFVMIELVFASTEKLNCDVICSLQRYKFEIEFFTYMKMY